MHGEGPGWACAAMAASAACACVVYYTMIAWFAHRERMAKIQQGGDPNRVGGEATLSELADRVIALERELDRLRGPGAPLLPGEGKPPIATEIKKSPPYSK